MLYFADLSPEILFDESEGVYYVMTSALTHFVGNTRWNVVSPLASSSIELVTFIPPAHARPLYVKQVDGKYSNSFMIPRWGGVVIFNSVPPANCSSSLVCEVKISVGLCAF